MGFQSVATNLVPGDTNGFTDVFVRDYGAGRTELESTGLGGSPSNGASNDTAISADDRYVVFSSVARVPSGTISPLAERTRRRRMSEGSLRSAPSAWAMTR